MTTEMTKLAQSTGYDVHEATTSQNGSVRRQTGGTNLKAAVNERFIEIKGETFLSSALSNQFLVFVRVLGVRSTGKTEKNRSGHLSKPRSESSERTSSARKTHFHHSRDRSD